MGCVQSDTAGAVHARPHAEQEGLKDGDDFVGKLERVTSFSSQSGTRSPRTLRLTARISEARAAFDLDDDGSDTMSTLSGVTQGSFAEHGQENLADFRQLMLKCQILFGQCEGESDDDLEIMVSFFKRLEVEPDAIIIEEGSVNGKMFFLSKGEAVVTAKDRHGFQNELVTLIPGDSFGETCLVNKKQSSGFNVVTTIPCVFYVLERKSVARFVQAMPKVANKLLERASKRLIMREHLPHIPALKSISPKIQFILSDLFQLKSYEPGQVIIAQNEIDNCKFCVMAGGVADVVMSGRTLKSLGMNDYFGEAALTTGRPHSASVVASGKEGCVVLEMGREEFLGVMCEEDSCLAEFALRSAGYESDLFDVLHHQPSRAFFETFISKEYAKENIDFWLAVEAFESLERKHIRPSVLRALGGDPQKDKRLKAQVMREMAIDIFDEFLNSETAVVPVTISSAAMEKIERQIAQEMFSTSMFEEIKNSVYHLMSKDTFSRFLKSEEFAKLITSIGAYELNQPALARRKTLRSHRLMNGLST